MSGHSNISTFNMHCQGDGIVNFNMSSNPNKMKIQFDGLPIIVGANVPPKSNITSQYGLYVYKQNQNDDFGQVFMKLN